MSKENVLAILIAVAEAKQDLANAMTDNDYIRKVDASNRLLNLTACLMGDETLEALIDFVADQRGVA